MSYKNNPITPSNYRSRLLTVVSLPIVSMFILAIVLGFQIQKLQESFTQADRTDQEIDQVHRTQKLMADMESGVGGFLVAANPRFLDSYNLALSAYPLAMQQLRGLVTDNPDQMAKLATLELIRSKWMLYAAQVMSVPHDIVTAQDRTLRLERINGGDPFPI